MITNGESTSSPDDTITPGSLPGYLRDKNPAEIIAAGPLPKSTNLDTTAGPDAAELGRAALQKPRSTPDGYIPRHAADTDPHSDRTAA